jgi:hypothetical protein
VIRIEMKDRIAKPTNTFVVGLGFTHFARLRISPLRRE